MTATESPHTIIIGYYFDVRSKGTEIVDDFLIVCRNVKRFSIHGSRGVSVSRFGAQLEELEILTPAPLALTTTCINLRELGFRANGMAVRMIISGKKLEAD